MADDMTSNVASRIKIIAPQITGLDDSSMQQFAADALADAAVDGFTDDLLERAAGYLAAHYAFIAFNQNQNVKKEAAAVLSREYFDSQGSDAYLAEYERLLASLQAENGGASLARFM
ncbi:DUF4054 domain-containing protein [Lacticaseibacillus zhaodongensis]|uniref:DUF4054 domain-containing protein n=1 Tax=Lacticaseibacillus zhaodongensis TaxID=2668065 RepID=UPI0012D2C8B7|nr:DUF4054 domain-containing protein [Lacticaseibacillus zhaodongensis]